MAKNVETVAGRSARLTQVLLGKAGGSGFSVTRESLLDAFLTLYDECTNEGLKRDHNVASFLEKFRETIAELRRLQVNIGDFEVKKIIGRGHYGEVNLVREKQTSNVYAMKKIHKSLTTDKHAESFYEKERDIMMKATSPWITRLQYSFHDSHYLYLVMEFHAGGDMLSLMERTDSAFPEENAQFYLTELVLAVHSVHNMGYVHRDIKPDNILLDRSGHIKLADFGSASKLNDQQLVTSKIPVGTPDYIAPEVLSSVEGSRKSYGVGCDWWAVGIVFYEMLFANTPFSDKTTLGTYAKILNFKNSLSIQEGASNLAVGILKGLLAEDGERFGYNELYEHPYFEGMNWTSIREGQAPYVPNISGQEDTSHFDEFDHEPSPPSVESFRQKKDFSGKGLPYIGFTYNAFLGLHPERSTMSFCISPGKEMGQSAEHQLFLKKKEHGELQKKFLALRAYETALRGQVVTSQGKTEVLEKRNASLEEELQTAQYLNREKNAELENLRHLMVLEREHRVNAERRAVTLVRTMYLKYNEYEHLKQVKDKLLDERRLNSGDLSDVSDLLNKAMYEEDPTLTEALLQQAANNANSSGDSKVSKKVASTSTSDLSSQLKVFEDAEETVKSLEIELRNTTQKLEESQEKYLHVVQKLSEEDGKASLTLAKELSQQVDEREKAELMVKALELELKDIMQKQEELHKKHLEVVQKLSESEIRMSSTVQEMSLQTAARHESEKTVKSLEVELFDTLQKLDESEQKYLQLVQEFSTVNSKLESESQEVRSLLLEVGNSKKVEVDLETHIQELQCELQKMAEEQAKKIEEVEGSWNAEKRLRLDAEMRLQEKDTSLQEKLKCTEERLQEVLSTKDKLENQVTLLEEKMADNKLALSQVEKVKPENVISVEENTELLSTSGGGGVAAKVSELEDKIKGLRSNQSTDRSKYFDLRNTLRVKERELSDVKLDLRLAQKDAKERESAVEEARVLREKLARTEEEHSRCPMREAGLQERVANLQAEAESQAKLRQAAETKLSETRDKYEQALLQQSLSEKEAAAKIQTLEALKTACTKMDEQLKTYEMIFEENEENNRKAVIQKHNLELALDAKGKEIKLLEEKIEKEKLERQDLLNRHTTRLEEERRRMVNSGEEATSLRVELRAREELEAELRKRLSQSEEKASQLAFAKLKTEQQAEEMEFECVKIKEEASRHITALANLKRSNVDLQEAVDLRSKQVEVMRDELERLQSDLDTQKVHYETELTKTKEQILQLNKLIYHLQSSSASEKKKSKWPFVFRSGGTKPAKEVPFRENRRSQMRRRENEMHDLQKKNQTPDTPSKGSDDTSETSSIASRGSHALEEVTRGIGIIPCVVCRKLSLVTKMVTCQDCGASCHRHCQNDLPNDCRHRSETLRRRRTIKHQMTFHIQKGEYASWVRMPRRNNAGWERRRLSLRDGVLYIHETGSLGDPPLLQFHLCPENDLVVVKEESPSAEAIQNQSEANLVIEIFSPCHPSNEMRFLVGNVEEKFKWLEVLEGIIQPHLEINRKILDIKALDSLVLTLEKENILNLRCCALLSNERLLLGAEEGLYCLDRSSSTKNALSRITQQSIHAISTIIDPPIVVLIQGKERWIHWFQVSSLQQQRSLTTQPLANLRDCHTVSTRGSVVALATSKVIYTWQWNASKGSFTLLQEIMTSQPCVSLHMGESGLLYATDTIHAAGLHPTTQGQTELQVPDALYVFAKGTLQQKGPVAIFGTRGRTYLVCFPAVGILLDGAGNQKQIKWTQTPHSFAYEGSHLFVIYHDRVEVIEIDPHRENIRGRWTYVMAKKPQHLGGGYLSTVCGSQLDIQRLDATVALDAALLGIDGQDKSVANSEEDFSFTSSVMDVLDASDQLGETRTLDSVGRECSM